MPDDANQVEIERLWDEIARLNERLAKLTPVRRGSQEHLEKLRENQKKACAAAAAAKTKDLIGARYGRLRVVGRKPGTQHTKAKLICVCDCGNTSEVLVHAWGKRKSCGCISKSRRSMESNALYGNILPEFDEGY
jgi:hypothetical protein